MGSSNAAGWDQVGGLPFFSKHLEVRDKCS